MTVWRVCISQLYGGHPGGEKENLFLIIRTDCNTWRPYAIMVSYRETLKLSHGGIPLLSIVLGKFYAVYYARSEACPLIEISEIDGCLNNRFNQYSSQENPISQLPHSSRQEGLIITIMTNNNEHLLEKSRLAFILIKYTQPADPGKQEERQPGPIF